MASYQGHLMFSSALGAAYGCVGSLQLNLDWGPSFLAAGVTTLGGLLPDLDSDSGKPVREMFGLAATVLPLLMLQRLRGYGFDLEQTLVVLGGVYLFIRFVLAKFFRRLTVHRGMFHSIPAMLISGIIVFQLYQHGDEFMSWYLAGGVMVGFLSHLVLDEIYAVDFNGVRIKLNAFAGSALKFWSPSWRATLFTYAVLGVLGWGLWHHYNPDSSLLERLTGKQFGMPKATSETGEAKKVPPG